jgi:hypothetical protein
MMITPICSKIFSIFDGSNKSYIYIWVSKKHKFIYVGETNERRGTFGRARSHIGTMGTLRKQVEEKLGESLEVVDDLHLLSFQLPQESKYTGLESSYRESIEYLVQIKLIEKRVHCEPPFRIISNVRPFARTTDASIQRLSENIVVGFMNTYVTI